jgi:predicted  nucleic acid-binding Zn-ribbon protein
MNSESGPAAETASGEWECMECGYVEEGARARRPAKCPDCGAPGQALEFFPYGDDEDDEWTDASTESLYDEDEDEELLDDDDDERSGESFPPGRKFYS